MKGTQMGTLKQPTKIYFVYFEPEDVYAFNSYESLKYFLEERAFEGETFEEYKIYSVDAKDYKSPKVNIEIEISK